ncbi:hypothetical protein NO989_20845, partial [Alteromonas sp. DY56-G5]|uniref:hypothetical protein n=1 Tax=Alteromonas sp. DY56-G5 TaxID=2967128 RepID=UPI00352B9380
HLRSHLLVWSTEDYVFLEGKIPRTPIWYVVEIKKVFGHLFLVTDNCCWNKSMLPFNSLGVQR